MLDFSEISQTSEDYRKGHPRGMAGGAANLRTLTSKSKTDLQHIQKLQNFNSFGYSFPLVRAGRPPTIIPNPKNHYVNKEGEIKEWGQRKLQSLNLKGGEVKKIIEGGEEKYPPEFRLTLLSILFSAQEIKTYLHEHVVAYDRTRREADKVDSERTRTADCSSVSSFASNVFLNNFREVLPDYITFVRTSTYTHRDCRTRAKGDLQHLYTLPNLLFSVRTSEEVGQRRGHLVGRCAVFIFPKPAEGGKVQVILENSFAEHHGSEVQADNEEDIDAVVFVAHDSGETAAAAVNLDTVTNFTTDHSHNVFHSVNATNYTINNGNWSTKPKGAHNKFVRDLLKSNKEDFPDDRER